ncbi:ComF family protein [Leptothermofonsia sp. ETS-13]|uniref:ComF family protein n=1 Tax=Leptothermofonsia sp. ETS-13 TaxID=3035696 RepID=UPI003B9F2A95
MKSFGWLRELAGFVLEANCLLCQRSTPHEFCQDCQRRVLRCQLPEGDRVQAGQPRVFAWGNYRGALKQAIAALKYHNQPQVARLLAQQLASSWLVANQATSLTVVPIPIHARKRQQRGYNQADLLAKHFCEFTRLPLVLEGLERSQETTAQFALSPAEREQNLARAFSLGKTFCKKPPSTPVLLIDDIYTTGATTRSAAQTLRRHGIRVHGIVVVARALRESC